MSGLGDLVRDEIRAHGPMGVARYMALALGHPRHGYYATRDPLGAAGDFTTAPEISQVFGELVGLCLGQAWLERGAPAPALLVELGPGRGTLMKDALRALGRALPPAEAAFAVHLVETSGPLRARQRAALGGRPTWHERLEDVPEGPLFLIANEFLDALPVRQFVRRGGRWAERRIDVDGAGRLAFVEAPAAGPGTPAPGRREPAEGAVHEQAPAREAVVAGIARRIAGRGGLALLVDYGDAPIGATGDTLQAVRGHRSVSPLDEPGTADLTTQVDFAALRRAAEAAGAAALGPLPQGAFLEALGAGARTEALIRAGGDAASLRGALRRLTAPDAMGTLFKVMALARPGDPPPPGFPSPTTSAA